MLSQTEESTLYLSILIMARVQPLNVGSLKRKRTRTKDLVRVIDKLVQDGLVIEAVTKDAEGIPRVTIEITDKGLQYLHEIEDPEIIELLT